MAEKLVRYYEHWMHPISFYAWKTIREAHWGRMDRGSSSFNVRRVPCAHSICSRSTSIRYAYIFRDYDTVCDSMGYASSWRRLCTFVCERVKFKKPGKIYHWLGSFIMLDNHNIWYDIHTLYAQYFCVICSDINFSNYSLVC